MKNIALLFCSFLFISACQVQTVPKASVVGETKQEDAVKRMVDKQAAWLLSHPEIHAASIGVYQDGNIHMFHYGELDPGKGNTPTDSTIYEIASISKTFTGTLVANAVLEGKLSLEDDIRKYLREEYPNLAKAGKPIQVKHLLTHTSGLPRALPFDSVLWQNPKDSLVYKLHALAKDYSKPRFLADLHKITLKEVPGAGYSYSNVNPNLIAHILENIYGKSFEDLLAQTIYSKAGLRSTAMTLSPKAKGRLANGYNESGVLMPHLESPLWGADGGLKSTLPDLMKYMAFHLQKENAVAQKSQEPLSATHGYFWTVRESKGTKVVSGHGGAFGTQTWFSFYPNLNKGIVVITNESDPTTASKISGMVPWNSLYIDLLQILNQDGAAKAIAFYDHLKASQAPGYHLESTETELNELGYHLLEKKRVDDAVAIFELNTREFPASANAFDSLGEAYLAKGDKEKSRLNYQKSLELNPENDNARKMLQQLQASSK